MKEQLFNHIDIFPENYHVPNGLLSKKNIASYCYRYEKKIKALEVAKIGGVTDEGSLALVEAQAYPNFLDIMAVLFLLNIVIMLVIGKINPREELYAQKNTEQVNITP
jgi:hypothetical protein